MTGFLLFGSFIVLLILGVPIAVSLAMATMSAIIFSSDITLTLSVVTQRIFGGLDSTSIMAIAFFVLAGNIMTKGGISRRLVEFANCIVGGFRGGMSLAMVLACAFFAALSGSAPATVVAIGVMLYPDMVRLGYSKERTAGLLVVAGGLGPIIPPSIIMVVYCTITGASVGKMFSAGMGIGFMIVAVLMATIIFYAHKEKWPKTSKKLTAAELGKSFFNAIPALILPIIILGGIYSGIFTPTESAVVAVVYCFVVSVFIYREIDLKGVYDSFYRSISVNGMTTFMVGLSMAFAAYLTMERIPHKIAAAMLSVTDNRIVLLLLINVFLLFIGCLIDNIPATIILSPILLPVVTQIGMSPITFGVMLTMNLAIGFVTPPYGINLFVAAGISGEPMTRLIKPMLFFIGGLLIALGLTTFCEPVTLGLLGLMK